MQTNQPDLDRNHLAKLEHLEPWKELLGFSSAICKERSKGVLLRNLQKELYCKGLLIRAFCQLLWIWVHCMMMAVLELKEWTSQCSHKSPYIRHWGCLLKSNEGSKCPKLSFIEALRTFSGFRHAMRNYCCWVSSHCSLRLAKDSIQVYHTSSPGS